MGVYISPETRLKLCELIHNRIKEGNIKLYPTLAKVGLKGPAFYSYLETKTVPSEEATAKIVSLALTLDYKEAMEIIREDLKLLKEFVGLLEGFASVEISLGINQIVSAIIKFPELESKSKKFEVKK